eukprot:3941912-Pyramimonas_sp.AAC.1
MTRSFREEGAEAPLGRPNPSGRLDSEGRVRALLSARSSSTLRLYSCRRCCVAFLAPPSAWLGSGT